MSRIRKFIRSLRGEVKFIPVILGLVLLAGVVSTYILLNQRLRLPWDDRYTVKAEFSDAKAVTPGQGQTVNVAGVQVGDITRVDLVDGVAVIEMDIDRDQLPAVYEDAQMMLRPRTLLDDMTVSLEPGTAEAGELGEDEVLPLAQTDPSINLSHLLGALDTDTRDYIGSLVTAGEAGVRGRGVDLRKAFGAISPVLERTESVTRALDSRREELRRLVHNLGLLVGELGNRDQSLRDLVESANTTFAALADEELALGESIERLPGTLSSAREALAALQPFAETGKPTFTRLLPTVRRAEPALRAVRPLLTEAPTELASLREFSIAARPAVRDLRPVSDRLVGITPDLTRSFDQLRYLTNELAYEPDAPHRGYLFWLAWFSHNVNSMLSTQDGNGPVWRLTTVVNCDNATPIAALLPALGAALAQSGACAVAPPPGP